MPLIRRQPRKEITASEAAKLLTCSRDTVKRIAKREGWRTRRNGSGPTYPILFLEAEVLAFRERTERVA